MRTGVTWAACQVCKLLCTYGAQAECATQAPACRRAQAGTLWRLHHSFCFNTAPARRTCPQEAAKSTPAELRHRRSRSSRLCARRCLRRSRLASSWSAESEPGELQLCRPPLAGAARGPLLPAARCAPRCCAAAAACQAADSSLSCTSRRRSMLGWGEGRGGGAAAAAKRRRRLWRALAGPAASVGVCVPSSEWFTAPWNDGSPGQQARPDAWALGLSSPPAFKLLIVAHSTTEPVAHREAERDEPALNALSPTKAGAPARAAWPGDTSRLQPLQPQALRPPLPHGRRPLRAPDGLVSPGGHPRRSRMVQGPLGRPRRQPSLPLAQPPVNCRCPLLGARLRVAPPMLLPLLQAPAPVSPLKLWPPK